MSANLWRLFSAILIAILTTALIGGCSDDDVTDPVIPESKTLMPLAVGNSWSYSKMTRLYTDGSIEIDKSTVEITGDTTHVEDIWYTTSAGEYMNKVDGLYIHFYYILGTYGPVVYRYPARAGDTYTNPALDGTSLVTVISLSKAINVPAGQFNCVGYNSIINNADGFWSTNRYFAPDVGNVLTESWDVRDENDTVLYIREELTRYELQ